MLVKVHRRFRKRHRYPEPPRGRAFVVRQITQSGIVMNCGRNDCDSALSQQGAPDPASRPVFQGAGRASLRAVAAADAGALSGRRLYAGPALRRRARRMRIHRDAVESGPAKIRCRDPRERSCLRSRPLQRSHLQSADRDCIVSDFAAMPPPGSVKAGSSIAKMSSRSWRTRHGGRQPHPALADIQCETVGRPSISPASYRSNLSLRRECPQVAPTSSSQRADGRPARRRFERLVGQNIGECLQRWVECVDAGENRFCQFACRDPALRQGSRRFTKCAIRQRRSAMRRLGLSLCPTTLRQHYLRLGRRVQQ